MGKRSYVNEHEVGVPAMLSRARLHLLSQRTDSTRAVRRISVVRVRCGEASNDLVQEVVDEVHLRGRVPLCAVHIAVERRVRHVKRRLPDVGEFCRQSD